MPTKIPNGKMTVRSSCVSEFRIQIVQGRKREEVSAFSKDNGNCVKSRDIRTRLLSISIQASLTMSEVPFRLQQTWFLSQLCRRLAGSTGTEKRKGTHSVSVVRSCRTPCDPMDCSLPGSTAHGISQERILAWVAISFSRGSS